MPLTGLLLRGRISLHSSMPQDHHLYRGGNHKIGWLFSYQSLRKCTTDLLTGKFMGKLSLLKVPFPKQFLTCVKLIISELRQFVYFVFHSWCSFLLCTGFDWPVLTVSCCTALYVWLMMLDCD